MSENAYCSAHYIFFIFTSRLLLGSIRNALTPLGNPVGLHFSMFVPTIEGQGTEAQKAQWLDKAKNLEIIGTYAQTELGHGTFVRGLETTATYDQVAQEFVINTPSLSAYKWWPGGSKKLGMLLSSPFFNFFPLRSLISGPNNNTLHPYRPAVHPRKGSWRLSLHSSVERLRNVRPPEGYYNR